MGANSRLGAYSNKYGSCVVYVLYQFPFTCIENFVSKVEMLGLSDGKKRFTIAIMFFGLSTRFQRRKEWICESRCRQVIVRLHVFARFFCPLS